MTLSQIVDRVQVDVVEVGHIGFDITRHCDVDGKNRFALADCNRRLHLLAGNDWLGTGR